MMRSSTRIVSLAFLMQAHAAELAATHGDAQNSMDMLADKVLEKMVIKLSDRLYAGMPHADLDDTALGKPGSMTIPTSRQVPVYAVPQAPSRISPSRNSGPRPPLSPARRFEPFKGPDKEFMNEAPVVSEEYKELAQSLSKPGAWEAMARASEALASGPSDEQLPYDIRMYVDGGKFGTMGNVGSVNKKYLESKIESALKHYQDNVQSVDVRLHIEGHEPKTYRMEVTVNFKKGKVVISNSHAAENTFIEAVDHMSDLLRRKVQKETEKFLDKSRKRHRAGVAAIKGSADQGEGEAQEQAQGGHKSEYEAVFDGAGDEEGPY